MYFLWLCLQSAHGCLLLIHSVCNLSYIASYGRWLVNVIWITMWKKAVVAYSEVRQYQGIVHYK